MDIKDYTTEMLEQQYTMIRCSKDNNSNRTFFRSPGVCWNIPPIFSLREARDKIALSKSSCEKLRRLKPGKKVQMTFSHNDHNNWWALRLDGNTENNLENIIQDKEKELKKIQVK